MRASIRSSEHYRWYALAVIMIGSMMGTLDASIANVAIPKIASVYHRGVDDSEWVIISFMLVTASTLVVFGRLGDMFGQKRIYLGGFAIFGASSLACALAPTLDVLIVMRAVQAIGAAMLVSSTQALIVDSFPATARGRAIGFNGAAVAVGLSLGPILGGAIVTFGDWRWIFLINVPISIVALIGSALVLKPLKLGGGGFDPVGASLSMCALFTLSLALSRSHLWGWTSGITLGLIAASIVAFYLFIIVERHVPSPTLDLSLFESRVFATSVTAGFVYFVAFSGLTFIVPLAAQTSLHDTAFTSGLLLVPITAMNIVLAPIAGALSDRIPFRYVSTAGAAIVTLGLTFLWRLPPSPKLAEIFAGLFVTGCGTAVFTQPNNSAIMGSAPPNRRGVAAATLATARTAGQLVGVAAASAVYFSYAARAGELARSFAPATAYFGFGALVMICVTVLSFSNGRDRR